MQRGILFLLFIATFLNLSGQRKSASIELSFHYNAGQNIRFKALAQPKVWSENTTILLKKADDIKIYLLKAGSRKKLDFNYDGTQISINFPVLPHPLAQLEVQYSLSKRVLEENEAWEYLQEGFTLNAFNLSSEVSGKAELGFIFPCFNAEKHYWTLNFISPKDWLISTPLQEGFRVELSNEIAHYYASAQAQSPTALYILAGAFSSERAEKQLEEIAENKEKQAIAALSAEEQALAKMQKEHSDLLAFLAQKRGEPWSQKDLEKLLEPAKRADELYLQYEMLSPAVKSKEAFLREQKIILNSTKESEEASQWQEEYYQKSLGKDYLDAYLHQRYQRQLMQKEHSWYLYLQRYLAPQNLVLADTLKRRDTTLALSKRESLSTAAAVYKTRGAIPLKLTYQYSYPRKAMRLSISQPDSNLFGQINLNSLAINAKDSVETEFNLHFNLHDTIWWPLDGAPRSIYISLQNEKWNFFTLEEERPESYYLYDFSQSKDPVVKRKALLALLETKNANLLATVMGIAIDSGERELQLLALAKAEKLNVIGKQKLAESIKILAEQSEDVKLKQKAAEAYKIIVP